MFPAGTGQEWWSVSQAMPPERHGAHGAPYRTRNSSCCFFNPKSTAPQPCHPCGCEIGVQIGSKPQQHGCRCGAPCAQRKILRRCTFLRCSRQAQAREWSSASQAMPPEKHGAHGAPYRTRNSSCCFFNPKSTAPLPCHPCGYEIGVQRGSKPRQHGSTCGRVRRAHQTKSFDAAIFPDALAGPVYAQPALKPAKEFSFLGITY